MWSESERSTKGTITSAPQQREACEGRVVADAPPDIALSPALIGAVYGQPVEVVRTPSGAVAVVTAHRVRGESVARG